MLRSLAYVYYDTRYQVRLQAELGGPLYPITPGYIADLRVRVAPQSALWLGCLILRPFDPSRSSLSALAALNLQLTKLSRTPHSHGTRATASGNHDRVWQHGTWSEVVDKSIYMLLRQTRAHTSDTSRCSSRSATAVDPNMPL